MADIEKIQPIGDTEQYTLRARTDSKGNVITSYYLPLKTAGGLKENSGGGSSNYFKLATLVITGGYVNRPIVFELSRRGYGFQKLEIMFASNSTNDPSLNYIRTDGEDLGFWINKTATSTWEVYGRYSESYGSCTVHRITGSATDNGVTVTLNLENIGTTQPEGTQARRGYSARYADIAVTLDSNAGSSTVPIYFSGGKPVQCSTTLGVSITGNAATATALTSSAGSSTVPIYFSSGKPVQCSTTLGINITGSSASCTGTSASANVLNINNNVNLSNCLQYIQTSAQNGNNDLPTSAWWHVLKFNHGNGGTYYKRLLAFNFWGANDIRTATAEGNGVTGAWKRVWCEGNSVTSAVWNDYAEYRTAETIESGYVLIEKGDDTLIKSTKRLQSYAGISSDTWGFAQGETETAKTPIAVAGRVLVYPYKNRNKYKPGMSVCTAPNGTVDIMHWWEKILYPDRIVGTVSCVPDYEEWGGGDGADRNPVKVDGRIWIKVR